MVFLLPPTRLKNRLLNALGHSVHPTAQLGVCLVIHVKRFDIGEGALIGHFNWFQDMALVRLGYGSQIMMFNSILGYSGAHTSDIDPADLRTLRLGRFSHVLSNHYLDCGGGVVLADDAWLTGIRSTVLTHAFDPEAGGIRLAPIVLENGAVVATSCTMLPGTVVGAGALLAAGSTTWTGQELAAEAVHGGVPARRLAPITMSDAVYQHGRYIPEQSS
jgi:acetyltransferase-like isoleucine patch superfamily enzyme